MGRPKSKTELLDLSQSNFEQLLSYVDNLKDPQIEFPPGTMNRNVRDVLAHLFHWHLMMLEWYDKGMQGEKPQMPAEGYTWKTVPELNQWIWKKYAGQPLQQIRKDFELTHSKIRDLIEGHTNEELFEKKKYPWTGSTSLGAYLISATSSHYDWGLKLIRRATK
jgi:hypothetical protein